ncbi:MAG: 50S ribosomal protein L11 [Candidatus Thermoplasmatota archaeon]|nr:50S ribosomal protein L11 [Candidatus Thermoplasmatota archaeon]
MVDRLNVLVDAGKATPGPPLGPALGPRYLNVVKIVAEINEKTKQFSGMKVPVTIEIAADRSFQVQVGTPPTTALILKEIGAEKGSGSQKATKIGNLTIAQVLKIAEMKKDSSLGASVRSRVKEVVGTCVSMGVTVEGKEPKEIISEINSGSWDSSLS